MTKKEKEIKLYLEGWNKVYLDDLEKTLKGIEESIAWFRCCMKTGGPLPIDPFIFVKQGNSVVSYYYVIEKNREFINKLQGNQR